MITEKGLTYEKKLKSWVSQHWRREDCVVSRLNTGFFLIFKGFDDIKHTNFFTRSFRGLRGHELKLFKPQVCLDARKYLFTIDAWNGLPV